MSELGAYRILIVKQEVDEDNSLVDFLKTHRMEVSVEPRELALKSIPEESPDAILVDIHSEQHDGLEYCQQIRAKYRGVMMLLTQLNDEVDEVLALEMGADDCLSKPVHPRLLLARLRARFRRTSMIAHEESVRISLDDLNIDASRREVLVSGEPVELTTLEFDLLWLLASNVGQVLSRNDIYQQLHGFQYDGLDRSVDLCVSRLRKKLGDDSTNPQRIKSIRAVGYLLSTG